MLFAAGKYFPNFPSIVSQVIGKFCWITLPGPSTSRICSSENPCGAMRRGFPSARRRRFRLVAQVFITSHERHCLARHAERKWCSDQFIPATKHIVDIVHDLGIGSSHSLRGTSCVTLCNGITPSSQSTKRCQWLPFCQSYILDSDCEVNDMPS